MSFGCLVELWALDVWRSYELWICLVELWDLDVWWSYGLWMFCGAMGLDV